MHAQVIQRQLCVLSAVGIVWQWGTRPQEATDSDSVSFFKDQQRSLSFRSKASFISDLSVTHIKTHLAWISWSFRFSWVSCLWCIEDSHLGIIWRAVFLRLGFAKCTLQRMYPPVPDWNSSYSVQSLDEDSKLGYKTLLFIVIFRERILSLLPVCVQKRKRCCISQAFLFTVLRQY